MKIDKKLFALLFGPLLLAGCDRPADQDLSASKVEPADTLLFNGRIYTLDGAQPWVEAVAIKDGKYSYVGDSQGVEPYRGEATRLIDLEGRMAMPGINDAHVHPVMGGIKVLYQCSFPFSATPADIAETLTACVEENSEAEWIIGGQWDSNFFINHTEVGSPRAWLDKISGDKAVMLIADSGHDVWVNSRALELAGVNRESTEVEGGTIVRDAETGEPNGLLLENATQLVRSIVPDWTPEQYRSAVLEAMRIANGYGITGMKDAWTSKQGLQAYKSLGDEYRATLHIATSISLKYGGGTDTPFDIAAIQQLRDAHRSRLVDTDYVKIFMDGVPTSSRTAAMLADYLPEHEGGATHNGKLHYPTAKLAEIITELDRAGITVKIHTAGDRSVRATLDAIEQTRKANGRSGLRHELAHAGFIDETDLPRFSELNAVADVSPYLWHPSPIIDSLLSAVGEERGRRYFPMKSLLESGAHVAAGSDWPAAVPSIDPWVGIEAMITRRDPREQSDGALWEEQAITLEQALRIYTLEGAKALKKGQVTGSVERGKSADIIVLDRNLFKIAPEKINETQVIMTLFEGKEVYRQPNGAE